MKYRVGRAIARRGRGIGSDRLDVELALLACHWYGAAVLQPEEAGPHPGGAAPVACRRQTSRGGRSGEAAGCHVLRVAGRPVGPKDGVGSGDDRRDKHREQDENKHCGDGQVSHGLLAILRKAE